MKYFVRAGSLEGFDHLVRSLGGNPIELLKEVGMSPASLRNPDTLISYQKMGELLEIASARCDCETFGLRLAKSHGLLTVGSIGLYMAQQKTLAESMKVGLKYAYLHARGAIVTLTPLTSNKIASNKAASIQEPLGQALNFDLAFAQNKQYDQLVQLSIHLLYRLVKILAGEHWEPLKITFRQSPPIKDIAIFKQLLSCPLEFNSAQDGIHAQTEILFNKPLADEQQLKQYVDAHFHSLEAQYPNELRAIVCHEITQLLSTGECTLENIAANLGLHPRVLQKRLKTESVSFRQLLEETRSKLACNILRESSIGLTELALQLGYAELAVFSRSFKRWHGVSPQVWRKLYQ